MTGKDCKTERNRRGLTLAEVAAKLETTEGKFGVSIARVQQIERMPQLSEEDAGRMADAILRAQWAKAQRLAGVGS